MVNIPIIESPFFGETFSPEKTDLQLFQVAQSLYENGYAIIDFPDVDFDAKVEAIQRNLSKRYDWDTWKSGRAAGLRIQDAWQFDKQVQQIAANEQIIQLLSQLYGKPAFPFQTLNFPVGTQQPYHTDCVHFSSIPERFMCGVWVAFEDVHPDAGPLIYYPGSHKLPIYLYEQLGVLPNLENGVYSSYDNFIDFWRHLVSAHKFEPIEFLPKKGQALIWAANLLHGGAMQRDKQRTRWSQVTHYYFKGCAYYTPLGSLPYLGLVQYRKVIDISNGALAPNEINGASVTEEILRRLNGKHLEPKRSLPTNLTRILSKIIRKLKKLLPL